VQSDHDLDQVPAQRQPFPLREPERRHRPIARATQRTRPLPPSRQDVVFRLAAAAFAVWVVASSATSPVLNLRPWWWPAFLILGGLIALGMLTGACMTMNEYLRHR
jgi:fatty acid desaturase